MNKTLAQLKTEAEESTTFREHQKIEWVDWKDSKNQAIATGTCPVCKAWVAVNTRPLPNDIAIGGTAVALNCGN